MKTAPPQTPALAESTGVPHRGLIRLKGVYPSLKTAEKHAADYLMAAPEAIGEASIVDVARAAGCSEATLVRLARKLGYPGFPGLKAAFAQLESALPYPDVSRADPPEAVARKIFQGAIQALQDTLAAIDMTQYLRAVRALEQARRMAFFGLGNAAVVAREAYQKFLRIGVPSYTAEDVDLQLIVVNTQLQPGDVVVGISYSGESRPILGLLHQARARKIVTVAITNFPRSSLARRADVVLQTAVFHEHLNGEIAAKRLAQLCVIESLYANYLIHARDTAREHLAASDRALALNKSTKARRGPGA
jgi:DNA-binding MurR/RpiR family transcriptional regulator